jgi:hypothetical protein
MASLQRRMVQVDQTSVVAIDPDQSLPRKVSYLSPKKSHSSYGCNPPDTCQVAMLTDAILTMAQPFSLGRQLAIGMGLG